MLLGDADIDEPLVVERIRDSGGRYTFFEITITEGRNRQVRRMVEALGAKVLKLVRIKIGPIQIGDLQMGQYRVLAEAEIRSLLRARPDQAAEPGMTVLT